MMNMMMTLTNDNK